MARIRGAVMSRGCSSFAHVYLLRTTGRSLKSQRSATESTSVPGLLAFEDRGQAGGVGGDAGAVITPLPGA